MKVMAQRPPRELKAKEQRQAGYWKKWKQADQRRQKAEDRSIKQNVQEPVVALYHLMNVSKPVGQLEIFAQIVSGLWPS